MLRSVPASLRRPVLPETIIIATICFVDMVWTIIAIDLGIAHETNPLMVSLMRHGMLLFAIVKTLSFLGPLGILEMLRPHNPEFIRKGMRFGLFAYLAIYAVGTIFVHHLL